MGLIATSIILKSSTAYQMTEDWLAFGNPHISEFVVTVLDTEPKICHIVYLCTFVYVVKLYLDLRLPSPVDVNT